jgi:hypothetical protein
MAARSATSTTKSDATLKTFVTFRVAGDALDPDEVTRVLRVNPTHAHRKGESYSTGRSTIVPDTGVWLLSTERLSSSENFYFHLGLALQMLGLLPSNLPSSGDERLAVTARYLALSRFLRERKLTATLSCFWHGAAGATKPTLPDILVEMFADIPIGLDIDFDRDEVPRSRPRVTSV